MWSYCITVCTNVSPSLKGCPCGQSLWILLPISYTGVIIGRGLFKASMDRNNVYSMFTVCPLCSKAGCEGGSRVYRFVINVNLLINRSYNNLKLLPYFLLSIYCNTINTETQTS